MSAIQVSIDQYYHDRPRTDKGSAGEYANACSAGQPEAFPARPYRQGHLRPTKVGSRVQGLLGVYGWLHEFAGERLSTYIPLNAR